MGRIRSMAAGAALLGIGALGMYVAAGPLNPPAGPVSSTYKTLAEVEPRIVVNAANTPGDASNLYIISQPGSYYLTGNVQGVSGKAGIKITSSDVTLDLSGYALGGVAGSGSAIASSNAPARVTVRRGSVHDWGAAYSVDLSGCTGATVEDLTVATTGSYAIGPGVDARVARCTVSGAAQAGIFANGGCAVHQCTAMNCQVGILAQRSSITACRAKNCGLTGIQVIYGAASDCMTEVCSDGFAVAQGGTASGCSANASTGAGFNCSTGATLERCAATGCGTGFYLLGTAVARGCVARLSGLEGFFMASSGNIAETCSSVRNGVADSTRAGFSVGGDDQLIGCTAFNNPGDGISCLDGCTVRGCSSTGNGRDGIRVRFGCAVRSCTSRSNSQDGIESGAGGMIVDNLCDGNGSAGAGYSCIVLTGYGARVEGNSLIGATYGVRATAASNVVVRNTDKNTTTPFGGIVAGNDVGPVGSAATATSPWSNIVY